MFTYSGEVANISWGAAPRLLDQSYTITADVEVPQGGAEGMLVTQGGRFGGYGFYLLEGRPVFTWDLVDLATVRWAGPGALAPGKHTLAFDFKYDGGGMGKGGQGVLRVDGKDVDTKRMEKSIPFMLPVGRALQCRPRHGDGGGARGLPGAVRLHGHVAGAHDRAQGTAAERGADAAAAGDAGEDAEVSVILRRSPSACW